MLKNQENQRKNPIHLNEGFTCQNCGEKNPKADKTCRNHCINCLYSLHVDRDVPGDRLSICLGLMKPAGISGNAKKGTQIIHICQKCGKQGSNKTVPDDNLDLIMRLMTEQNIIPPETRAALDKKHSHPKYSRYAKNRK